MSGQLQNYYRVVFKVSLGRFSDDRFYANGRNFYEKRTFLYVNIDSIAILKEAWEGNETKPVEAALVCEKAGCNGITGHLRENKLYIHDRDVFL
jgi:hypothetical protein